MAKEPAVQRKAQQELDLVIGGARLPTMDDISSLPYVQAILLEVTRWMPVVPMGIPHRAMVDDEYRGMHIPAGCMIIPVFDLYYPVRACGRLTHLRRAQNVWYV